MPERAVQGVKGDIDAGVACGGRCCSQQRGTTAGCNEYQPDAHIARCRRTLLTEENCGARTNMAVVVDGDAAHVHRHAVALLAHAHMSGKSDCFTRKSGRVSRAWSGLGLNGSFDLVIVL